MAAIVRLANCDICKVDFPLRVMLKRHIKKDRDISIQIL